MAVLHPRSRLLLLRTFIGIELGETLSASLDAHKVRVTRIAPQARWLPRDSMHLTLTFLGEMADSAVPGIDAALARVGRAHGPFSIRLRGSGIFGPLNAAKVLWAGFDGDLTPLRSLQRHVVEELGKLGIPPDFEVFEPHVTLARCKNPRGDATLVKCADVLRTTDFGDLRATEVVFCTTVIDSEGMKYAPLSRHLLTGPGR